MSIKYKCECCGSLHCLDELIECQREHNKKAEKKIKIKKSK